LKYKIGGTVCKISYLIFQAFAIWGVIHHVLNSRKNKVSVVS
jgi:hypothetical protein